MTRARDAKNHPDVYRSVSTTRAAVFATAGLVGFIVIAALPGRGEIVGYIFAPVFFLVATRWWRLGVHVETHGVKVVGSLLSKRIAWEEIDRFEVRPWLRYPYQGYVVLTGGRAVPILGIGAAGRPKSKDQRHRRQAQEPIDRLNEALAQWREASSGKKSADAVTGAHAHRYSVGEASDS